LRTKKLDNGYIKEEKNYERKREILNLDVKNQMICFRK